MDEISMLRLLDRKASLYYVLSVAAGDAEQLATPELLEAVQQLPEPFREKCRSFWQIFQQLRTDSTTLPLEELIREIYDTTDFLSVMQLYQDGEKKRANLNLLIQYARQYEAQGQAAFTGGVTGFLRYIDALLEHDRDLEQANLQRGRLCGVPENHAPFQGVGISVCIFSRTGNRIFQAGQLQKMHVSDTGRMGLYLYDAKNYQKYQTLSYLVLLKEKNSSCYKKKCGCCM